MTRLVQVPYAGLLDSVLPPESVVRTTLANGLRLLVRRDTSAPVEVGGVDVAGYGIQAAGDVPERVSLAVRRRLVAHADPLPAPVSRVSDEVVEVAAVEDLNVREPVPIEGECRR